MAPSRFVLLESLPLTPNGKVDRRALPAPEAASDDQTYIAPQTPMEIAVTAIWSEILQRDRVGLNDHFFELGGHSLLAVRMNAKVRELTGFNISLQAVFKAPTVKGYLAALFDEIERELALDSQHA